MLRPLHDACCTTPVARRLKGESGIVDEKEIDFGVLILGMLFNFEEKYGL
jgi:hypothetical protein